MNAASENNTAWLIDSHVHLYPQWTVADALASAQANMQQAASRIAAEESGQHNGRPPLAVLMLTERASESVFAELRENAPSYAGRFQIETGPESAVLQVTSTEANDLPMLIIAGRQIVTDTGLEVLALCCEATFDDRQSLGDTLDAVRSAGALPVLPFGVGKWRGQRAALVRQAIDNAQAGSLVIGDNAGRLLYAKEPELFGHARSRGVPVLPGSDPLPLPGDHACVGRYGFVLQVSDTNGEASLDPAQPSALLKAAIASPALATNPPTIFGQRDGLMRMARVQLAMQLRKRLSR